MKILRVFPHRTNATPDDKDVRIGSPTLFDEADKVLISVTFTWDIPKAERLADEWNRIAPTEIGGVAYGKESGEFEVGKFLKIGNVITSRGCPNKCSFCSVWKREPKLKELEIKEGNIINDDNLLACNNNHIKSVFAMLKTQKEIEFKALEAERLKGWHIEEMLKLKIKQMFFAYDMPEDLEPLIIAGKKLQEVGYNSNKLRCYVLIGYKGDTFIEAKKRLRETWSAGFLPFAMLYTETGKYNKQWRRFQRLWTRPAATKAILKNQTQKKIQGGSKLLYDL